MNRRRFLKYAAAGVALAASSVAGYELDRWQSSPLPPSIFTKTVTHTATATATETLTNTRTVAPGTLELELFADWHGDGAKQSDESFVTDAVLDLWSDGYKIDTIRADSDGKYRLTRVHVGGKYRLTFADEFTSQTPYRFFSLSNGTFKPVKEGFDLAVSSDQSRLSLGVMVGFLSLPFRRGTPTRYNWYFDDDPSGRIRDWKGGTETRNGHEGTDFGVDIGIPVVAAASGVVSYVDDWGPVGIFAILSHKEYCERTMSTLYAHLSRAKVAPNQPVKRGELLGFSGEDKTKPGGHLHFELEFGYHGSPTRGSSYSPVDPFRAVWNSSSICYWTKDNDPQYTITG